MTKTKLVMGLCQLADRQQHWVDFVSCQCLGACILASSCWAALQVVFLGSTARLHVVVCSLSFPSTNICFALLKLADFCQLSCGTHSSRIDSQQVTKPKQVLQQTLTGS